MRNLPLIVLVLVVGFGLGYYLNGSNEQAVEQEENVEVTTSTLDAVKAKGYVQCGVSQGLPGFQMLMITAIGQVLMWTSAMA